MAVYCRAKKQRWMYVYISNNTNSIFETISRIALKKLNNVVNVYYMKIKYRKITFRQKNRIRSNFHWRNIDLGMADKLANEGRGRVAWLDAFNVRTTCIQTYVWKGERQTAKSSKPFHCRRRIQHSQSLRMEWRESRNADQKQERGGTVSGYEKDEEGWDAERWDEVRAGYVTEIDRTRVAHTRGKRRRKSSAIKSRLRYTAKLKPDPVAGSRIGLIPCWNQKTRLSAFWPRL